MSYRRSRAFEGGNHSSAPTRSLKKAKRFHYDRSDPRINEIGFNPKRVLKTVAEVAVVEEAPELEPLIELISSDEEEEMKGKRRVKKKSQPRRARRGPTRLSNGYLRPERLHIRDIVPWKEMGGTKNRWSYHISLASLITPFKNVYDEFRVLNLRVKFFSDAQEGGATGCYTGILMDQNGFGDFGAATGSAWFKSIGCFPGSVVKHRGENITLTWRPTEPSAREWRRGEAEGKYVVASVFFADDGEQETEIGGTIHITGTVLARGRWYNVPTLRAEKLRESMNMDQMQMGFELIGKP